MLTTVCTITLRTHTLLKYSWSSVQAVAGKKVYINDKGVKDKAGTTWYRLTFSTAKNAKQYWV